LINFRVIGVNTVVARMAFAAAVGEAAAEAAAQASAAAVLAKAQAHAPVDTGELRDSGILTPTGFIFTADHAMPVEVGTSTTPAQPFVRPVLDEDNTEVALAVGRKLIGGI